MRAVKFAILALLLLAPAAAAGPDRVDHYTHHVAAVAGVVQAGELDVYVTTTAAVQRARQTVPITVFASGPAGDGSNVTLDIQVLGDEAGCSLEAPATSSSSSEAGSSATWASNATLSSSTCRFLLQVTASVGNTTLATMIAPATVQAPDQGFGFDFWVPVPLYALGLVYFLMLPKPKVLAAAFCTVGALATFLVNLKYTHPTVVFLLLLAIWVEAIFKDRLYERMFTQDTKT